MKIKSRNDLRSTNFWLNTSCIIHVNVPKPLIDTNDEILRHKNTLYHCYMWIRNNWSNTKLCEFINQFHHNVEAFVFDRCFWRIGGNVYGWREYELIFSRSIHLICSNSANHIRFLALIHIALKYQANNIQTPNPIKIMKNKMETFKKNNTCHIVEIAEFIFIFFNATLGLINKIRRMNKASI